MAKDMTWDSYFLGIAEAVSKKSHCLSRQLGAVAVLNNFVIATGYNGPPAGYPHCEIIEPVGDVPGDKRCPRHRVGYQSGQGLDICPAAHAELNVLIEAARIGVALEGATLYITSPTPCRECAKAIVNAGIVEVVYQDPKPYPDIGLSGKKILETCGVKMRILNTNDWSGALPKVR